MKIWKCISEPESAEAKRHMADVAIASAVAELGKPEPEVEMNNAEGAEGRSPEHTSN